MLKFKEVIIIIILGAQFFSCSNNTGSEVNCDEITDVEYVYIINGNKSATIIWKENDVFSQYSIYRDSIENISVTSSNFRKSFQAFPRGGFTDTGLTNGKNYYYKLVLDRNCSGVKQVIISKKIIEAHPMNYSEVDSSATNFSQIRPIINSSCATSGCHSSVDKLPLATFNNLLNDAEGVTWVIPFKSTKSHLIFHVNRDTLVSAVSEPVMPEKDFTLPKDQVKVLMNWIDSGAKNEFGTIPFSEIPLDGISIITNQGEDISAVLDLSLKRIIRYVTTGVVNTNLQPPQAPHNVTIDKQNKFYYVNLIAGNKILKFQLPDHKKISELVTGIISPAQVWLSLTGDTAYVSNFTPNESKISVIDTKRMSVLKNLSDPRMIAPHGISVSPDGKYAISANQFSDNLTLINCTDNSIIDVIPLSARVSNPPTVSKNFEPYQTVFSKDGKFAFITCAQTSEVRVLDIEKRKIIDSISVGLRPLILDISPNGNFIYTANRNSNSVSVINVNERRVTETIYNVGQQPHGIAISPKGDLVIVSCENLLTSEAPHHPTVGSKNIGIVTLISTASNRIIKKIEVGNFAAGVAVTH